VIFKPLAGSALVGHKGTTGSLFSEMLFEKVLSPRTESNYASIARTENGIAL